MTEAAKSSPRRGPLVLGINAAYHQTSAALVCADGILAAVEEERFNRVKHGKPTTVDTTYQLPIASVDYCLREAGCTLADVDWIAYSFDPRNRRARSAEIAKLGPILAGGYETLEGDRRFLSLIEQSPSLLAACFGRPHDEIAARWVWVDHHLAHLASAYLPSPFDAAAGLVVDGIGEAATTTIAHCRGLDMEVLRTVEFPHSIGFVWERMTNFLGFEGNYDEGKVMGLAAYGDPERYLRALHGLLEPLEDGTYRVDFHRHEALLRHDYRYIERLLGGVRHRVPHEPVRLGKGSSDHADIAASLQALTNDVLVRLARSARELTSASNLVIAGGVGLNAVANGAIAREAGFDDMWVQPAASDAGTALGAALHVLHHGDYGAAKERVRMPTAYLGPAFDDDAIVRALDRHRLQYRHASDAPSDAAYDLARGLTVGWFQGRMEFGPRALGNRSLLADPRVSAMRERINRRVKHRQEFRPFAPTVLAEYATEWFDADALPAAAGYMLTTWQVRPERRSQIPAVTHIDGSSRIQVLHEAHNPDYYRLIDTYRQHTGVPMVLNTSFNDREPMVCTPDDAARCFLKTNIDVMYLGSYVVEGPKPWERDDRRLPLEDAIRSIERFAKG